MSNIDPRDRAASDYRVVKNVSGGTLVEGTVVMFTVASEDTDHVAGLTVLEATVAGEERVCGILAEDLIDDEVGRAYRSGRVELARSDDDVAEGDQLVVASTAGELATVGDAGAGTRVLGIALDADTAAGLEDALNLRPL